MLIVNYFLMLLTACQLIKPDWTEIKIRIRKEFPEVQQLSIEAFQKKYSDNAFLVDVREKEEYEVSHIKGSINLTQAKEVVSEFKKSEKKVLVLYCSVGYRSSKIAQKIQNDVKRPVFNLEGSIFEWANSGLPVYRRGETVHKVHPYNFYWGKLLKEKFRE